MRTALTGATHHLTLFAICVAVALCGGCAASYEDHVGFEQWNNDEYKKGRRAAKTDLRRGVLAYEDIQCEEEEGWRVMWCYRKILKDKYGVDYRIISPSLTPGSIGRKKGYQSIVQPILDGKLGAGWQSRIFGEAKVLRRDHWQDLEALYEQDRASGAW